MTTTTEVDEAFIEGPQVQDKLQSMLQILGRGDHKHEDWMVTVQEGFEFCENIPSSISAANSSDILQFQYLANELWNRSVTLKSEDALPHIVYAKMRFIAYQVKSIVEEPNRKLLTMGLKVAKSLLEQSQYQTVEKTIASLKEGVEKLVRLTEGGGEGAPSTQERRGVHCHALTFNIYLVEMELYMSQGLHTEAVSACDRCKELLVQVPSERQRLSNICYNYGVDDYNSQHWFQAVVWLNKSYALHKDLEHPKQEFQARTLRLLSNCYIDGQCDNWDRLALDTIVLANKEDAHIAGLMVYLKLIVVTQATKTQRVDALRSVLEHRDCKPEHNLRVISLLKKHGCLEVMFEMHQMFLSKTSSGMDEANTWLLLLDALMTGDTLDMARTLANQAVTVHNSEHKFEESVVKQLNVLFWKKAGELRESGQHQEAVNWYNFSLNLFPSVTGPLANLGKLHRNMAACYFHMDYLDKAKESAELAEVCEPGNLNAQFMLYKIALIQKESETALACLHKLLASTSDVPAAADTECTMVCMAAQKAMEHNQESVSLTALQAVIARDSCHKSVVAAVKCVCRIVMDRVGLGKADRKDILVHIKTGYDKLMLLKSSDKRYEEWEDDVTWFRKLAWNMALDSKEDSACMKDLFSLCAQLLTLCSMDGDIHKKSQTCRVMCATACLELARTTEEPQSRHKLCQEVLQHVEEYKLSERRLANSTLGVGEEETTPPCTSSTSQMLVIMFEFEALTKLNDPRAEAVLEKVIAMENPEPKLFHNLAALALNGCSKNLPLCLKALNKAISLHLQQDTPDFTMCSSDVRHFIDVAINSDESEVALRFLTEILEVIENRAKCNYPETEILWLMTRVWNYGLNLNNCARVREAETWCSLSMKLLKFVSDPESHQEQMTAVYGHLLARLERQNNERDSEE